MTTRLEDFIEKTADRRGRHVLPVQARKRAEDFMHAVLAVLFPHFAPLPARSPDQVSQEIEGLRAQLAAFLRAEGESSESAQRQIGSFVDALPSLHEALVADADALYQTDPAAHSVDEVILAYPGFLALACHRIAHALLTEGVELLPRLISESAHRDTGIDIHPGARIGRSLSIDHGTGVVIGETTDIGANVRLYQGVTLGALSVRKDLGRQKRHPTIEDDVVVYAGATILGGDTVIGKGSVIGGNVWLTHTIPPGSVVTHGATVERARQSSEHILEFNI
jgi:serine O-acetyltransferase